MTWTPTALLDGVTVLDCTNVLAGPFAGYQLASLGARVVKVESPDGDLARRLGASADDARAGMGISFCAVNAGKASIAIDLKHPDGGQCCGGSSTHATCSSKLPSRRDRASRPRSRDAAR